MLLGYRFCERSGSGARYHAPVIRRFYVHNFRCFENFELPVSGHSSVLLIGQNGSGKSSVAMALEVLQKIARGTNRVNELVKPKDFFLGRTDAPMRFEIEVELGEANYRFMVGFEFKDGDKELHVRGEQLTVDGQAVYARDRIVGVQVVTPLKGRPSGANPVGTGFGIDSHLVALPILQEVSSEDPLPIFKRWLARMLILRPTPSLIAGDSNTETLEPDSRAMNFGAWFAGLLAHAPAAYGKIDQYLRPVLPDMRDIRNPLVGKDARSLLVQFASGQGTATIPFADLSDGEKCFLISAVVLAGNEAYGPLLCCWDEPDAHLAPSEVGHFVLALRKAFESGGQLIATSHNPEAIRHFSEENTLVFERKSHLEPTTVRPLRDLHVNGDLVGALIRGDLDA